MRRGGQVRWTTSPLAFSLFLALAFWLSMLESATPQPVGEPVIYLDQA
jgi:hypothetical protein